MNNLHRAREVLPRVVFRILTPLQVNSAIALSRLYQAMLILFFASTPRIVMADDNLRVIATEDPVQVYVLVTANDGTPIDSLSANAFQLGEDGSSQTITTTVSTTNLPVSTIFVMDYSPSMRNTSSLAPMEQAVKGFISLMASSDEAAVIKFNGGIGVVVSQGLTSDKSLLNTAVDTDPGIGSSTNLYDAINEAINVIGQSTNTSGTHAIVVLSDGDDNISTTTFDELSANLETSKTPVFAIGYGDKITTKILKGLADGTGGAYYSATNDSTLFADIYTQINNRLKFEYSLTYFSAISDCNVHALQVKVATSEGTKTYDSTFRRCFSTTPLPTTATTTTNTSGRHGGGGIDLLELCVLLLLCLSCGFLRRTR